MLCGSEMLVTHGLCFERKNLSVSEKLGVSVIQNIVRYGYNAGYASSLLGMTLTYNRLK